MSLLINEQLKEFLQKEDIRQYLSDRQLDDIYEECDYSKPYDPNYLRPSLTYFFIVGLQINPLDYMTTIPNNFIADNTNLHSELMKQFVKKIIIPKNITTIEEYAIPKNFNHIICYLGTVEEFTQIKGCDTLLNYHSVECEDGVAKDINPIKW